MDASAPIQVVRRRHQYHSTILENNNQTELLVIEQ
jgi:hypothetical protein